MKAKRYIRYLIPSSLFGTQRTKKIVNVNPTVQTHRQDAKESFLTVYDYNEEGFTEDKLQTVEDSFRFLDNQHISWINVEGLIKADVEKMAAHFGIHPLIAEDILSISQRPKMDEVEGIFYCLLNMLYFNKEHGCVETEQISIVLGNKFIITFQEDPERDVFNPIREKLRMHYSKLRQRGADYLCYSMLDIIVDNYFLVMEGLGEKIEEVEEEVIRNTNTLALAKITQLRKELIILKRNIAPVRDMITSIIRSESELLDERTIKYFKDVYDHIVQAHDLCENYRDVMVSMQDLYINNVNLRMNEVMKVMAIVTCLLAPATVIGGIFGMNFQEIPLLHNHIGFWVAVGAMLLIPVWMLRMFRKRGWF
ncbi:magnesium/cobalt transporter CorA [Flavisolibacter nicotianae]|uniref:magnesium/cobalt transporter CorA n=1 Tax=Flavisolibacter nicotianae TaxID=2364882 RepID=UPI000EB50EE5|nr:magnesium/cobalt transporter CorA [Flavisolibacter nicotianae]